VKFDSIIKTEFKIMTEMPITTKKRMYNCPKCKKTHNVILDNSLAEGRNRYPFPYVFLHSTEENLKDLLTILYLDAQLQIRAVDIIQLENSKIFSEELAKEIMEKLTNEIVALNEENLELKGILENIELPEEILPDSEVLEDIQEPSEESLLEEELDESQGSFKEVSENVYRIKSKTPGRTVNQGDKIALFFVSTIGPGEKRQKLTIFMGNVIYDIKETIGNLYGLMPANFHLSHQGVTLDETSPLNKYPIKDGDEILIIPASIAGSTL